MRILPTGASVLFFYSYKANEENNIILSGTEKFQMNDEVFYIGEWSVIRYRRDATGIWIVFQPPSAF